MRRYKFLILVWMLLLGLTPLKAEVGSNSYIETKISHHSLEIRKRRGASSKVVGKFLANILSDIENPTLRKIVEFLIYGFLLITVLFFVINNE